MIAVAALARALLFHRFPALLTNDSGDFILGSERIAVEWDFMSRQLRDWRLPGYPVFLAALQRVGAWTSASLVAAQKIVGVACAALGMVAAWRLRWRVGSLVVGSFLALQPVYLFNEHLVMSEALFTLLLWAFATLSIVRLGTGLGFVSGLLLGAAGGMLILTRSNGLLFLAPFLATLTLHAVSGGGAGRTGRRRLGSFLLGLLLTLGALLGSWTYRNHLFLGQPRPFTNNVTRSMVVYLAQHDLIDPELSEIRRFRHDPASPTRSGYRIIRQLGPSLEAEELAGRIVREQIGSQKRKYVRQVLLSSSHFLGFPVPGPTPGRRDMTGWFETFVRDLPATHRHNARLLDRRMSWDLRFTYVRAGRDGRLLRWWADAGVAYLDTGRCLLAIAFFLAAGVFLLTGGWRVRGYEDAVLLAMTLGYLSVAAGHGVLLADYDRYAVPFDGLQVFVVAGVVERIFAGRRSPTQG